MNPSSEGFTELREKILSQALPLLDSDTLPPEDRFRFSFQVAQMKGSLEAYTKAFQIAEKMEGDDKLRAYLDLLSDVDYVIQEKQEASAPSVTTPTQSEVTPNQEVSSEQTNTQSERTEEGQ